MAKLVQYKDSLSYELRLKAVLSDLKRLHENFRIVILHRFSKIRRSRLLHWSLLFLQEVSTFNILARGNASITIVWETDILFRKAESTEHLYTFYFFL